MSKFYVIKKKYTGTKKPFGFCIPGMSVYNLAEKQTVKYDKFFGRNLKTSTVKNGKNS